MKKLSLAVMLLVFGLLLSALAWLGGTGPTAAASDATGLVRCLAGMAGPYPCDQVHLLAHLPLDEIGAAGGVIKGNDHWGWTDPATGRDYVLFGLTDGVSFIDITDRENPLFLGKLPSHDGSSVWRDIKVYRNHAFIVGDVPTQDGLQVFDLTQLRDVVLPPVAFTETVHYDGFDSGHNLWIDEERGVLFVFRTVGDACNAAIHMLDVRDPLNPAFLGCFDEGDAPLSDSECVVYRGPDADYSGHQICFTGSDDNVSIGDVTDKGAPHLVADFTYPGIERAHQGALTADQRYWLLSDTMDEERNGHNTRTYVFDVADLDSPQSLGYYEHATTARDHNLYIIENIAYQTNWQAGLRLLDISSLPSTAFDEVGYFDIVPASDSIAASGSWSNYPWWRDRVVTVSGSEEGLFVLGPVLPPRYSTFLGGNLVDQADSIAIDGAGNAYVTGVTESTIFPTATLASGAGIQHGVDAFVAKLTADGSAVEYIFWFDAISATDEDQGFDIAVDGVGNAYVTGQTRSVDFCAVFGATPGFDATYNGNGDAFVFKVKADGSGLAYCTFLGGNDWDTGRAIAVDEAGNAYVTGGVWSTNFPTTTGALQEANNGLRDSFVAKLDPSGLTLAYSTYLGGAGQDESRAIALDAAHNAYVTGWTNSSDFYTSTGAFDPDYSGGFDTYLVKLDSAGDSLAYATYLGGGDEDRPADVAVDAAGAAYLAGYTQSPDFPTTAGAFDEDYSGGYDGFVAKMSPTGSDLVYATLLGGSGEDWVHGLDVSVSGVAHLAGETWSADFPTTTLALRTQLQGGQDGFAVQLSNDGSALLYASFLGGSDWDKGTAIAADDAGHAFVAGATRSADFPVTPLAYDTSLNGDYDAFVAKLAVANVACFWADLDCGCSVDAGDITQAAEHWGCRAGELCYDPRIDRDGSGEITVADVMAFAAQWGWGCAL